MYKPESQDVAQKDWTKEASEVALLKGILQVLQGNALGVDMQYSSVSVEKKTVMAGLDIREPKRWWDSQIDFSLIKNTVFRVDNTTEQELKITFWNGPLERAYRDAAGLPITFTVPADTFDMFVTPDDLPILRWPFKEGITFQVEPTTGVAPTRGVLAIDAYTAPIL